MKRVSRRSALGIPLAMIPALSPAQLFPERSDSDTLPNGKSRREAILQAEYKKTLKDVAKLVELSEELKAELEKSDPHVLSVSSLKKTEEIEKLAKRIRSRLRLA